MGPGDVIGMLGVFMIFGAIPITALLTRHQQKIEEIRARVGNAGSEDVKKELTALRNEVAALRETTTKFDLSFDAAITRLEQRVDRVEDQVAPTTLRTTTQADETSDVTVRVRR